LDYQICFDESLHGKNFITIDPPKLYTFNSVPNPLNLLKSIEVDLTLDI